MSRIPMTGERHANLADISKQMDEALPRMLRECLEFRNAAADAGEDIEGWDKQIEKVEGMCRLRGIAPEPIKQEFNQQRESLA
ncbi:hypothetical protein [Qipengyuania sp.]|uniref:hypothetical protein n=1 Tax=Qipengyuania sp. TaxID=2004515 RepID=UPI003516300B